jgi:O-antigen/teichoic acid export membrane protein
MVKIIHFLKKFYKHKTFQNIGYLTAGNILSQIVALIGAFYIPKLLGPEQYGIYNIVIAYVGLFTVFTFSGLTKVIIREIAKDTANAKEILESTIGLRNLFSIFGALLSIVVVLFIDYELGTKAYIAIYSFSLIFKGIHSSLDTIYQAHQRMKVLGVIAFSRQLIRVPGSIFLLLLGYGVLSLIILHLSLEIMISFLLYRYSKNIISFNFFSKVKFIKEYIYSGIRFSLLQFLNILSGKIDLVMLSFFTTPQNVGIYALAYRLVEKGLILRSPISQSLFPYYSSKFNNRKPKKKDLLLHTGLISVPLIIFIIPAILFIKPIIANVIGIEFIESASIFSVLVLYLILNFSVIPWGLVLQTTSNEKYSLITVSVTAFLNICLNIIFYKYFGLIGIAYSTLVVESMRFFLLVRLTNKYVI